KSVIGRNCVIGNNVTITNSYVWDNAIIQDNSVLDHTIVAADAKIGKHVTLSPGSVIGFNVIIGDDRVIPNNVKIVETPIVSGDGFDDEDDFSSDGEQIKETAHIPAVTIKDVELVGEEGKGFAYESEDESVGYEDESTGGDNYSGIIYQMKSLNISDESIASITNKKAKKNRSRRRFSTNSM
ncbi:Translation initiation factor eIF-2B epsilon subunit, partial [Candida maltosa Xu316]